MTKKSVMERILQSAAPIEPIKNAKLIDKTYRYWRMRLFYSMYLGYVFFYFTRKSFTFAMPALMNDLGFSPQDLGKLSSLLYITYGISKFTSGALSDRSNPRFFMSIGLILTGVFSIFFGLSSNYSLFMVLICFNGWFQGWGWPPVAKQLSHWYARSERGTWWSVCSSSHNVGGWLITLGGAWLVQYYGWRHAMVIPGIISILAGFCLIERMRDSPQSLGLPPIDVYKKEAAESRGQVEAQALSVKQILFEHVLNNKRIWALACAYFFVYVVRTAMNDWTMVYLVNIKGYQSNLAGLAVSWFEVGGFIGTLAAGMASDYFSNSRRVPYMILCGLSLIVLIPVLGWNPQANLWLDSTLIGAIGFFVFGPQMLAGLAAAEWVDKKAAGTANGFAGLFGYFGAAASGYPLGQIIDAWGWQGFFMSLTLCAVVALLFLLPMWSTGGKPEVQEASWPSLGGTHNLRVSKNSSNN